MPDGSKIALGLLLDDWFVPQWLYRSLERVQESGVAHVALAVLNDAPRPNNGIVAKAKRNAPHLLYALYTKADAYMFGRGLGASKMRDLRELFPSLPTLRVKPDQTRYSDRFSQE